MSMVPISPQYNSKIRQIDCYISQTEEFGYHLVGKTNLLRILSVQSSFS